MGRAERALRARIRLKPDPRPGLGLERRAAGWATNVEPLLVNDLTEADAVLLVSSVRKIIRVHTLDGVELPDSTGPWAELSELYEREYA